MKATPSTTTTIRRYFGIYLALWKNSIVREMGFKSNFLLWILVEVLWFALQLSYFAVIYSHTDNIAGWTKWEVVLLIGTAQFIQQLFTALFLTNVTDLSELIRTGKLDFLLLLPVNTRFLISFRKVDLGGFINAGMALVVVGYACHQLRIEPTLSQLLGFLILSIAGVCIHYTLVLMLAASAFWTVRSQGVVWCYYNLFNIARMPRSAFQGSFKVIFTFALPMLLIANVPAELILQRLGSAWQMALLLVITMVWWVLSEIFWRFSLRHYTSASS